MADRLMLLDTASMYFRAFYGVPDSVTSPRGEPVNAVRGLLDFIARMVGEYHPTHLACCWDNDWRPAWRVALVPSYKAHRVESPRPGDEPDVEEVPDLLEAQVPVILEVLAALGIAVVGADGYEADDVIGTLATGAGMPVDIVTGDRDLFQLVDDAHGVRVLYIARGVNKHERLTDESIVAKYAVLPAQYADFATLRGDSSDGLPGVAGVGEKTASALLLAHGDLQGIVDAAADPDSDLAPGPRRRITDAAAYLAVAPRVVAVARDLDLGLDARLVDLQLPTSPAHPRVLADLVERWGLESSVRRVTEALTAPEETSPAT